MTRVALIGLGEVGGRSPRTCAPGAIGPRRVGHRFRRSGQPGQRATPLALAVATSGSAPTAVAGADLVVSAVTAAQCVAAAESVAPGLRRAPGSST